MFAPWRNSEKLGETQRNLLEIPGELEAWFKSFLHFYIFKMTWNAEREVEVADRVENGQQTACDEQILEDFLHSRAPLQ